jgi:hypothetical protein
MKRALYSLDDEEFVTFLGRTQEVLQNHGIPYMFVGGVASQAHIASALTKQENKALYDLAHNSDVRIQDHLRATDDVDITLDLRAFGDAQDVRVAQRVLNAVADIEGEGLYSSPMHNVVEIKLERHGAKRPVFRLGLNENADSSDRELSLNFYYSPQDTNTRWPAQMVEFDHANYYPFFDSAQTVALPYSQTAVIPLRVKGLEALLATKLARARPKDWADIIAIYQHSQEAGIPLNVDAIKDLLCAPDPRLGITNEALVHAYTQFLSHIR